MGTEIFVCCENKVYSYKFSIDRSLKRQGRQLISVSWKYMC